MAIGGPPMGMQFHPEGMGPEGAMMPMGGSDRPPTCVFIPSSVGEERPYLGITRLLFFQLDWVGPVDNRPSPDELHRFVKKKNPLTPDT